MNDKEIICCAQLLYGGIKEYHAVVIKSDIFPGSGDYEDPVDVPILKTSTQAAHFFY